MNVLSCFFIINKTDERYDTSFGFSKSRIVPSPKDTDTEQPEKKEKLIWSFDLFLFFSKTWGRHILKDKEKET